jgi:hypothetical protein
MPLLVITLKKQLSIHELTRRALLGLSVATLTSLKLYIFFHGSFRKGGVLDFSFQAIVE